MRSDDDDCGDLDDSSGNDAYESQKRRSAEYQRRISAAGREIGAIPEVVDADRKESCRYDLRLYLETYHKKAFKLGWCPDHLELIEALQHIILTGGQLAIGMPRGTGKTTIVIRALLWAILYGHHTFAVFVAATDPKAQKALAGIRTEIGSSLILMEDFPEVCYPVRCIGGINNRQAGQTSEGKPTRVVWSKSELHFPQIEGSDSSGAIVIVGGITGSAARGPQFTLDSGEVRRPTICLLDDPQDRTSARNPDTVQTYLDTIDGDIAEMGGPDQGCAMLATVTVIYPGDVADQLLDQDERPEWNGIRKKFLLSMPTNMHLWDRYKEISRQSYRNYRDNRLGVAFYLANRQEMDAGAKVSWEQRFDARQVDVDGQSVEVKEVSAIQYALHKFLFKKKAFLSELQNEPLEQTTDGKNWKSAKQIAKTLHPQGWMIVPEWAHKLVAHVDVHNDLLYWAIGALGKNGRCAIIGFGTNPDQRSPYFQKADAAVTMIDLPENEGLDPKGAIENSLYLLCCRLLDRSFVSEVGDEKWRIDLLLIDYGHEPEVVNRVSLRLHRLKEYRGRVKQMKGFGVAARETPINERKHKEGTEVGNNCYCPPRASLNEAPRFHADTNYWKAEVHDRWSTPTGQPGSLSLPTSQRDYQGFSEHQKAEHATKQEAKGRAVYVWDKLPSDNHWFDNTVGIVAGGSFIGCDTPSNKTPEAPVRRPKPRKRRKIF